MHCSSFETESNFKDGGEVLVAIATLVTEGRIPGKLQSKSKGFYEGPHCTLNKQVLAHKCDLTDSLCMKFGRDRNTVLNLWKRNIPLCVEVLMTCACKEDIEFKSDTLDECFLLEKWDFNISYRRNSESIPFNINQLVNAIKSQLYFSQLTAWLTTQDENTTWKITKKNLRYRVTVPGETLETSKFSLSAIKHNFPLTDIGHGLSVNVSYMSLPRMTSVPKIECATCAPPVTEKTTRQTSGNMKVKSQLLDDRMYTLCTIKGKHRCEDYEDFETVDIDKSANVTYKRHCQNSKKENFSCNSEPSTSTPVTRPSKPKLTVNITKANLFGEDLNINGHCCKNIHKSEKRNTNQNVKIQSKTFRSDFPQTHRQLNGRCCHKDDLKVDKGQLLLDAIERSGLKSTNGCCQEDSDRSCDEKCVQKPGCERKCESDNAFCDMSASDIFSIKKHNNFKVYVDNHCDSPIPKIKQMKTRNVTNAKYSSIYRNNVRQKITFEDDDEKPIVSCKSSNSENKFNKDSNNTGAEVPSALEQAKFRKNLDNAASMVFHSRTGLPLTSSPAPVRRGKSCFDFDSSLNSVSAIKSALFSTSFSTDDESESEGSIISPCSPETYVVPKREPAPVKYHRKGHAANLLGSFEESVLNGRLEPVSTVHGFRAELGASGSFVPKHLVVPVTVFFYTLGDNDKVSSPYLSHINLGKKGYNVPKSGTVQVTLFNPLGTVVKMFVIMYDLSDMPPNSQTFIRQRTLYMPTNCRDPNLEWGPKWLRYLIHLRFMSSKSGKIYLHSDIRMIIFRKCDMDTATAHGIDMSYELRSFTHMPTNPRFSPRK